MHVRPMHAPHEESFRPALRPVESIVVPDPRHGRVLVLRDTQGVTSSQVAIPEAWVPVVARFDGTRTCEEIAQEVSVAEGVTMSAARVVSLAEELERALFLEGPRFRAELARVREAFLEAPSRPAAHAGAAYSNDPAELREYLDTRCLSADTGASAADPGALRALVAPHIDPWRGAVGYGHAYGALARALARQPEIDTVVLLGTSHAPMRQPFALCRKDFETPLGLVKADLEAIDALAAAAAFDPYEDQFNHKREHSLEFQAVFLRHLAGERRLRVVPILAGLGEHQARGSDPASDDAVRKFLDAIGGLVSSRAGRVILLAGADLAHVGPRFGDAPPSPEARAALGGVDHVSLAHAAERDADGFWRHVAADLDTRRVCGLAPIYATLRALGRAPGRSRADLLHYEQTVDEGDGSVVSHAAMAFFD